RSRPYTDAPNTPKSDPKTVRITYPARGCDEAPKTIRTFRSALGTLKGGTAAPYRVRASALRALATRHAVPEQLREALARSATAIQTDAESLRKALRCPSDASRP